MEDGEETFRIGEVNNPLNTGKSAKTRELAKFAAGHLDRHACLVMERTHWEEKFGKVKPSWTVIEDAERFPGEWKLGVYEPANG